MSSLIQVTTILFWKLCCRIRQGRFLVVPWEEYEPCPVSGRIQFVQDDVHVFRELAFEEAYITRYKEKMDANGYPMSILLTILRCVLILTSSFVWTDGLKPLMVLGG